MIRPCESHEIERIHKIINMAAEANRRVIPSDCWKEPYMSEEELQHEIDQGVIFWGYYEEDELLGAMGIQLVRDVALIRHAYVVPVKRNEGIGGKLLSCLRKEITRPILIGTWAAARWAVCFYEKHGFKLVSAGEKDRLLRKYWGVPQRQMAASIDLADQKWFEALRRRDR